MASPIRERIYGAIRAFTCATVSESEAATGAIVRIVTDSMPSSGWRDVGDAPEDEHVILATSGGHVGEAIMLRDEDTGTQKWAWAIGPVHESHKPLAWKAMPRFAGVN